MNQAQCQLKYLSILGILMFLTFTGFSQGTEKAIGIRGGITSGFEYRVFSGDQTSYRALLSARREGLQLTGLKEFHKPAAIDGNPDFSFIYGLGAHAGFESWHKYYGYYEADRYYSYRDRKTSPVVGLDALAGIEYSIPDIPLVIGIEAKPFFNLFGKNFFQLQPFDFAFTVKYTF